jgi:tetratricopeptide (TPR) repeat protein
LHSYEQAAAFLRLAQAVTDDPDERARLKEREAEAAETAAQQARAEQLYEELIALHHERADLPAAARVVVKLARVMNATGRVGDATARLEEAAPWVESGEDEETRGALSAQLARAYMLGSIPARAVALADEAIGIAERGNDLPVLIDAIITKGTALIETRAREAETILHGAVALADRHELYRASLRARGNLANVLENDDPRLAHDISRDAVALARRLGMLDELWYQQTQLGLRLIALGDTAEAVRVLREILDDESAPETSRWFAALMGAIASAYEGDATRLEELRATARRLEPRVTNPEWLSGNEWSYGFLAYLGGDLDTAAEQFRKAAEYGGSTHPDLHDWYGRVLVQLGRLDGARAELASAQASSTRGRVLDAHRLLLEAAIAAADEDPQAPARYEEANQVFAKLGAEADRAIGQLDLIVLFGPDEPMARAAADELRKTSESRGWGGVLARLDSILDSRQEQGAAVLPS